jgi:hypothetical protein
MPTQDQDTTKRQGEDPITILRPKYVQQLAYLETFFYSVVSIFTLTVGIGTIVFFILSILQLSRIIPMWLPYTLIFALSCIFMPPFIFETIKRNTAQTGYKFYQDHILFQHFQMLFFRQRGRLKYADIQDIFERSNIVQGYFGTGNVWILAPGTGIAAGRRFPGLKLSNIELNDDLTEFFEAIMFPENFVEQSPQQKTTATAKKDDEKPKSKSPRKKASGTKKSGKAGKTAKD